MKLKQTPEDFFVEELTDVQAGAAGEFSLYRLEKRGWTTPDALQAIRQRWRLDWRRFAHAGLKDRHAHTIQYLTILRGPERRLTQPGIHLEYLGHVREPFTSRHICSNRFRLAVRSLADEDVAPAATALEELGYSGVPNYFDDQRFGSVLGGQFIAKALVLGEFEQALRLALAEPYEHDRSVQKKEKAFVRTAWGDWARCWEMLGPGQGKDVIGYLAQNRDDFRGAVGRLRPELRGLYMSAYQSHLWNRMLSRWLRQHLRPEQLLEVELSLGTFPMHRRLEASQQAQLEALQLPLPAARGDIDALDPAAEIMNSVLAEEGLTRQQLKVEGLRKVFFSRGVRSALCLPIGLAHAVDADELNVGRKKMILAFDLPRGSYATLLVKRAFGSS